MTGLIASQVLTSAQAGSNSSDNFAIAALAVSIISAAVALVSAIISGLSYHANKRMAAANETMAETNKAMVRAAEESVRVTREGIEHELRREQEEKRANVLFPENSKGSLWVKERSGQTIIIAIPVENIGHATARDLSPEAFINDVSVPVEGDAPRKLEHNEIVHEAFYLRVRLDDSWSPPESKVIKISVTYGDNTGNRRYTERCFQFQGREPMSWKSSQFSCD